MANNKKQSPPIYATAYWLYKAADFLYVENIGLHFGVIKKILDKQNLKDNNTLFIYSTSLLNKIKNMDRFPEVKKLIEMHSHIEYTFPNMEKVISDLLNHIPNNNTIYGDSKDIAIRLLENHIHPIMIIAIIKQLSGKNAILTEIDSYLLLKREFPYMKIPKTLALEYLMRRVQK